MFSQALKKAFKNVSQSPPPIPPGKPSSSFPEESAVPQRPVHANAVYFPNWKVYQNIYPTSLNYTAISHVFHAFLGVKADGTVYLADEYADAQIDIEGQKGCLGSFWRLKQVYPHLRVIVSIGGGAMDSAVFASAASTHESRQRFGKTSKALVDQYGLDGIDVDWEHPSNAREGENYVNLLAELRSTFPAPRYMIASALSAGEWALRNIRLSEAQKYLDFINVMAYDFSGPWTKRTGHHAQLFQPKAPKDLEATISGSSATEYIMRQGVPSHKILLGVPVYGRSFLGSSGIGQRFTGHAGDEGTFEYKDLPRPGSREYVDQSCAAAYCVDKNDGFVSYDTQETVRIKGRFAVEQNLGGLFFWTAAGDRMGPESLVLAGAQSMNCQFVR